VAPLTWAERISARLSPFGPALVEVGDATYAVEWGPESLRWLADYLVSPWAVMPERELAAAREVAECL